MNKPTVIDHTKVPRPEASFTQRAIKQLRLIIENDFTLAGLYLRILISGKGCDGFTYSTGFTELQADDHLIEIEEDNNTMIIMDSFTAFYLQNFSVDFVQDLKNDIEGFVITNNKQKEYAGKFWRAKPELTPPLVQR